MIRFTVLLGHCVMSFCQYETWYMNFFLNGKLSISFIYLQCNAARDLSHNDTEAVK